MCDRTSTKVWVDRDYPLGEIDGKPVIRNNDIFMYYADENGYPCGIDKEYANNRDFIDEHLFKGGTYNYKKRAYFFDSKEDAVKAKNELMNV